MTALCLNGQQLSNCLTLRQISFTHDISHLCHSRCRSNDCKRRLGLPLLRGRFVDYLQLSLKQLRWNVGRLTLIYLLLLWAPASFGVELVQDSFRDLQSGMTAPSAEPMTNGQTQMRVSADRKQEIAIDPSTSLPRQQLESISGASVQMGYQMGRSLELGLGLSGVTEPRDISRGNNEKFTSMRKSKISGKCSDLRLSLSGA